MASNMSSTPRVTARKCLLPPTILALRGLFQSALMRPVVPVLPGHGSSQEIPRHLPLHAQLMVHSGLPDTNGGLASGGRTGRAKYSRTRHSVSVHSYRDGPASLFLEMAVRLDVRLPPIATAKASSRKDHVCFIPKSGHVRCNLRCLLWAKSGHAAIYMPPSTVSTDGGTVRPRALAALR
jgi:hypothetical protein